MPGTMLLDDWRASINDQLHQAADEAITRARAAQTATIAPIQQAAQQLPQIQTPDPGQVGAALHSYVDQLGQQAGPAVIQVGQNAADAAQQVGTQVLGGAQQAQAGISDALHQHVDNLVQLGGGTAVQQLGQPPVLGGTANANRPVITSITPLQAAQADVLGGPPAADTSLSNTQVQAPSSNGPSGSIPANYNVPINKGPTISRAQAEAVVKGTPLEGIGGTIWDMGVKYNVDPAFALSVAKNESAYGDPNIAPMQNQSNNIWDISGGAYGGTPGGRWGHYATKEAGAEAFYKLITSEYYPKAQDTVGSVMWGPQGSQQHAYAPLSENSSQYPQRLIDTMGNYRQLPGGSAGPSSAPSAPVTTAQARAADLGYRDISQFGDSQLTSDEAYAACGPAAAVRFAEKFGRNPTLREATDLAKTVGWTSGGGMAGIASEQKLMSNLGVDTKVVGRDWAAYAQEAQTGNPVTISTPGHYYFADGYNPESGAFHVGRSGLDLKGGSEWMTPAQMENLMGQAQGALFANNPTVPNRGNTTSSNATVNAPTTPAAKPPIVMGGMQDANGQPTAHGYSGPNLIQTAQDAAGEALGGVGSAVGGAASALGGAAQGAVQGAQQGAVQVAPILGGAASAAGSTVRSVADDLGQAAQGAVSGAQQGASQVINAAAPVLGGAQQALSGAGDAVGQAAQGTAQSAAEATQDAAPVLGGTAASASQMRQQVQDTIDSLPLKATVAQARQAIGDTLDQLGPRALEVVGDLPLPMGGTVSDLQAPLRGAQAGLQTIEQQRQQQIAEPSDMAAQFQQNVAAARRGDWAAFAQGTLGLAQTGVGQTAMGGGQGDLSQSVSAALTAGGIDPNAARVLGQVANVIGPIALERAIPSVVSASARGATAAVNAGLEAIDRLAPPEVALATTRQAGESADDYLARLSNAAPTSFRAPATVGGAAPLDITPSRRLGAPVAGTSADRLDYLLDRGRYAPAEEPPIPRSPSSGGRPLSTTVAGEAPLNVASSAAPLDINPSGRRLTDVPSGTSGDQLDALLERGRHAPPEERPTPTMLERANTVRLAGLLSSTTTHLVNATGNLVNGATAIPQQVIASGFDAARVGLRGGSRQRYLGEVLPMVKSWVPGVISSVPDALEILRTGVSPQTAGKLEHIGAGFRSDLLPVVGRMLGTKGGAIADSAIEMPLRMLQASDVLFRGGATSAFTNSLATRKALQEGFKGPALQQRVGAIMANLERHPELVKEANDQAARVVFQEQRQVPFIGRQAGKALEGSGALRFAESQVLPFTKTPANITAQGMGLSPLGWASVVHAARSGNPGLALDRAARASLGTAAFGVATWMGAHGMLTGAYPDDPDVRSTLPNGWREWSVRLPQSDGGAVYVPMQNFGAYGWPMAMAAIATEASSQGKPMDPDQVGKAVTSMGRYVLDNTFLQGLSDATNALHDPERYGQKLLESEASSFVPYSAMGRQLENMSGMVNRNPREGMQGILDAMAATNPVTAGTVPARTNALGDTVSPTVTGAAAGVLPLRTTVEQDDPTLKVLRDNGVGVTNIASAVNVPSGSVKLTEAEQEDFKKVRGDLIKRYVASETRSPDFVAARSVTARNKYLSDAVQRANRDARETMINKWAADRDTWRSRIEKKAVPEPYYLGGTEGA